MVSTLMWRNLGIGAAGVTGAVLLGLTKGFNIDVNTNLFNTGVPVYAILGIAQIIIAIAIWNNRL